LKLLEKLVLGDVFDMYELAHGIFVLDASEVVEHTKVTLDAYENELRAADTVLVSKTDLVPNNEWEILRDLIGMAGADVVEPVYEGVCDGGLFSAPSTMLDFYADFEGEIALHDGDVNYTVIGLGAMTIEPAALQEAWPTFRDQFGLRRMKGDIVDTNGERWHVEATPSQCRVEPGAAEALQLVCIGERAREITEDVLLEELSHV
jgi:G3E family GTPase